MDIYRVKVVLREIKPPIWRRIGLSGATTLKQFHRILQIAMGWEDSHLHEFSARGQRFGPPGRDDFGSGGPITEAPQNEGGQGTTLVELRQ